MSKDKRTINSDNVMQPSLRMQQSVATLEKHSEPTGPSIPKRQIFSQELIARLTDRIKKL